MKKALILILLCSIAVICMAEWSYDSADFIVLYEDDNASSSNTNTLEGEIVAMDISMTSGCTGSVVVVTRTNQGRGAISGPIAIYSNAAFSGSTKTNFASSIYVAQDQVAVDSSYDNAFSTLVVRVKAIIKR